MKAAEIRKMKIPQIEEALMDARHELLNSGFKRLPAS